MQLELHSTGSYVTEKALVDINEFLKEISTFSEFRYKGHVTTKDIERAEARILRQLYNQISGNDEQEESNQTSKKLPSEVLNYYRDFMIHLEGHLNERQRGLLEKTTNQRPTLPFHLYLIAQ